MEKAEFPGPELDDHIFEHKIANDQCKELHKAHALHHIIRKDTPEIIEEERKFWELYDSDRSPSVDDIKHYRKMISKAEERVFKSGVNIILCTCNEAGSGRLTNALQPKYCIIDECAMATEPECMVPIHRAEHVVLIGDHQQLQPVIQSKEAEKMGLRISLFKRYVSKEHGIHMLQMQYRMVSICL